MSRRSLIRILCAPVVVGAYAIASVARDPATDKPPVHDEAATVVRAKIANVEPGSTTTLSVESVDATGMNVKVWQRNKEVTALRFVPNGDGTMRPEPGVNYREGVLGAMMFVPGRNPPAELRPWTEFAARTPHDDASVYVVSPDLVLLALHRNGAIVGVYYALAPQAGVPGGDTDDVSPMMQPVTPKQRICALLYETCIKQASENWVHACGYWLQWCQ